MTFSRVREENISRKPAVLTSYVLRTGADRPIIHRAWNEPMTGCSASTPANLAPVLYLPHLLTMLTMPTRFHRRWRPPRADARLPVPTDSVLGRSCGLLIIVWRAGIREAARFLSSEPCSRRIAVATTYFAGPVSGFPASGIAMPWLFAHGMGTSGLAYPA